MNDSDVVVFRGIPFATAARFGRPERIAYEGPHQHRSPVAHRSSRAGSNR